jgi:hypothetical protein
MSKQSNFVLGILLKEGSITRLTAQHYNIGNINAVIGDLRKVGHDIGSLPRTDAGGNPYNQYVYLWLSPRLEDMRPTAVAKRYNQHRRSAPRDRSLTLVGGISMTESMASAVTSLAPRSFH